MKDDIKFEYLIKNEKMRITKMSSSFENDGHIVWMIQLDGEIGNAIFIVNNNLELRNQYEVGKEVKLTIGDDDKMNNNRMALNNVNSYRLEFICDKEYPVPSSFNITFNKKIDDLESDLDLTYSHLYSIRMENL